MFSGDLRTKFSGNLKSAGNWYFSGSLLINFCILLFLRVSRSWIPSKFKSFDKTLFNALILSSMVSLETIRLALAAAYLAIASIVAWSNLSAIIELNFIPAVAPSALTGVPRNLEFFKESRNPINDFKWMPAVGTAFSSCSAFVVAIKTKTNVKNNFMIMCGTFSLKFLIKTNSHSPEYWTLYNANTVW